MARQFREPVPGSGHTARRSAGSRRRVILRAGSPHARDGSHRMPSVPRAFGQLGALVTYQSAQRFERRDGFEECWIGASSLEAAVLFYIERARRRHSSQLSTGPKSGPPPPSGTTLSRKVALHAPRPRVGELWRTGGYSGRTPHSSPRHSGGRFSVWPSSPFPLLRYRQPTIPASSL